MEDAREVEIGNLFNRFQERMAAQRFGEVLDELSKEDVPPACIARVLLNIFDTILQDLKSGIEILEGKPVEETFSASMADNPKKIMEALARSRPNPKAQKQFQDELNTMFTRFQQSVEVVMEVAEIPTLEEPPQEVFASSFDAGKKEI